MRVCFLLDSLAPGGTETSTVVLATALLGTEVSPSILTLGDAEHSLEETARSAGVPVERVQGSGVLSRVRSVRRHLEREGVDILHTALFTADQIGRLAAWGTDTAVVSSFVSTPYETSRFDDPNTSRWKVRACQLIDATTGHLMVDRFHSVSEGAKRVNRRALRLRADRVDVVERGRSTTSLGERTDGRRSDVRTSLGLADDAEVVLNLGRLDHQKAHTVLIEATSRLARTRPNLVTLIAGKNGSATEAVRAALESDPVADRHVRLLGHRSDIGDLLSAADVLAISSNFEGTAGAAVEAMAVGVPVVSTDIVGVEGVLTDGVNARLSPRADPAALAEAIEEVLDHPVEAQALVDRGRIDFATRFTLDVATENMATFYADVVGADGQ